MPRVLVTEPIHDAALALLRDAGVTLKLGWEEGKDLVGVDAVLVRVSGVSARDMAAAHDLKIVSKHGVGIDNIDQTAAAARGIVICNTPGANAHAVAEHAMMLMLGVARNVLAQDRAVRTPEGWRGVGLANDLEGRRVLLAGFGAIGQRLAALCTAFGMKVTVWHRSKTEAEAGYPVVRDLAEGLPQADVLALQLPLNGGTRGLIGARELDALPEGAIIINVGRGGIVDEDALAAAATRLGGIGFDVFAQEPLPQTSPLLALPNAILTPHHAALSDQALHDMAVKAAQNVLDFFSGRLDPACIRTLEH